MMVWCIVCGRYCVLSVCVVCVVVVIVCGCD